MLCLIFQRYKLRANHNEGSGATKTAFVVLDISKIQIESKSQHVNTSNKPLESCA